jgi:hypothetical protein
MPDRAIPYVRPPGHKQVGSNPNCRFGMAVSCKGAAAHDRTARSATIASAHDPREGALEPFRAERAPIFIV